MRPQEQQAKQAQQQEQLTAGLASLTGMVQQLVQGQQPSPPVAQPAAVQYEGVGPWHYTPTDPRCAGIRAGYQHQQQQYPLPPPPQQQQRQQVPFAYPPPPPYPEDEVPPAHPPRRTIEDIYNEHDQLDTDTDNSDDELGYKGWN